MDMSSTIRFQEIFPARKRFDIMKSLTDNNLTEPPQWGFELETNKAVDLKSFNIIGLYTP